MGAGIQAHDLVRYAWEACDDKACNEDPIEIPMELWASGHTPGSTWNSECARGGCGYYTGGTCTVRFEGETGSWEVRDALVELLIAAAYASQKQALDVHQESCTWWLFTGCEFKEQTPHLAMPTFMKAVRWADVDGENVQAGMLTMNVQCAFDARGEDTNWGCVAASLGAAVAGAVSGGAGAVLGTVATLCDAMA